MSTQPPTERIEFSISRDMHRARRTRDDRHERRECGKRCHRLRERIDERRDLCLFHQQRELHMCDEHCELHMYHMHHERRELCDEWREVHTRGEQRQQRHERRELRGEWCEVHACDEQRMR